MRRPKQLNYIQKKLIDLIIIFMVQMNIYKKMVIQKI